MQVLGRWCFRHRWTVVVAWIIAAVAATAVHAALGSAYTDNFSLPHTQSSEAVALLQRNAPKVSGDTDELVVETQRGTVDSAAVRSRLDALLARVRKLPGVTVIGSPYEAGNGSQVSPSKRIAFATITFDETASHFPSREAAGYDKMIAAASGHGIKFALSGQVAEDGDPNGSMAGMPIGFLAAGIVLFLVFGTLAATLLPLLTASAALVTGMALIGLMSHLIDVASFSGQLSLLIGLGVGIDYALFIVTRYRQAVLRGVDREQAVIQAMDTSGRAVLFAGIIVCIAMLGMFLLGVSFLYGVAVSSAIAVALTVVGALTLLPALLSLFGGHVLRRGERRAVAEHTLSTTDESAGWARWAGVLRRRPVISMLLATAVVGVMVVPFFSMRLGNTDASSDAPSSTTYQAYYMLVKGFGAGYNGPLQLVAQTGTATQRHQFAAVVAAVDRTPDVVSVTKPSYMAGRRKLAGVSTSTVYERGPPQAASTSALLTTLRDQVIPGVVKGDSIQVLVGGETAIFADFSSVLTAKLPLFIAIVVLVSALLLVMLFRSLAIPATAALMNLLSTAASLGAVTAIFQYGWGGSLLGITAGPIMAFVPILMFPILFGLSMDYEVFLICRIHEEWHRRGDNAEAVSHGLAATGKTITAAAAIMILVFASFVLGGQRIIEIFGIGLASAVFIDAVIVRSVLVPAVMFLLGKANWKLPHVLDGALPHLRVEGEVMAHLVPSAPHHDGHLLPHPEPLPQNV